MITPIRGRKRDNTRLAGKMQYQFRNDNPDKGTETQVGTRGRRS